MWGYWFISCWLVRRFWGDLGYKAPRAVSGTQQAVAFTGLPHFPSCFVPLSQPIKNVDCRTGDSLFSFQMTDIKDTSRSYRLLYQKGLQRNLNSSSFRWGDWGSHGKYTHLDIGGHIFCVKCLRHTNWPSTYHLKIFWCGECRYRAVVLRM